LAHNEDTLRRGGASTSIIAGLAVEVQHDKGNAKQGADGGVNETAGHVTGVSGFAFLSSKSSFPLERPCKANLFLKIN
jgi:hypothetical protein